MRRTLTTILCLGAIVLTAAPAAAATPSASAVQQQLQELVALLNETAEAIEQESTQIGLADSATQQLSSACASPQGSFTAELENLLSQLAIPAPAAGTPATPTACAQLGSAVASSASSAQRQLASSAASYATWEKTIAMVTEALSVALLTTDPALAIEIAENELTDGLRQTAQSSAATTRRAPRRLAVTVRGRRGADLRSIAVAFDGRRVARRDGARLTARIPWRGARPGLHRIRVVAHDAGGRRLRADAWVVRRDERVMKIVRDVLAR